MKNEVEPGQRWIVSSDNGQTEAEAVVLRRVVLPGWECDCKSVPTGRIVVADEPVTGWQWHFRRLVKDVAPSGDRRMVIRDENGEFVTRLSFRPGWTIEEEK